MKHRRIFRLWGALMVGFLLSALSWAGQEAGDKSRSRMSQLFIWRVSDRLHLSEAQETRFAQEYKKLTDAKRILSEELDTILNQIEKVKDDKAQLSKLMVQYSSKIKQQQKLIGDEIDTMSKIFDSEKMAQYLLLKREMTQKFRDVLTGEKNQGKDSAPPSAKPLKDPEIIEEK